MPERKKAIAREVTNLKNIVGMVLEEDYEGAVDELEVRKDELMNIHSSLINLDQADGAFVYDGQSMGQTGAKSYPFVSELTFSGGELTGGIDYSGTGGDYDGTLAGSTKIFGKYSVDLAPMMNPDAGKW